MPTITCPRNGRLLGSVRSPLTISSWLSISSIQIQRSVVITDFGCVYSAIVLLYYCTILFYPTRSIHLFVLASGRHKARKLCEQNKTKTVSQPSQDLRFERSTSSSTKQRSITLGIRVGRSH